MSLSFLRRLPLFVDLPEADLESLWQNADRIALSAGDWLMREGEAGDALYVVMEGSIEITKRSGQQEIVLARRQAGDVIGEMALLDHAPRSASGRAIEPSRVLQIDEQAFNRMLSSSPKAVLSILRTVNARLQSTEALLRQNEKMAALGTLAAGLAHELNNPAAAMQRSAAQLQTALADWQRLTGELDRLAITPAQRETIGRLRTELPNRAATPLALDPLAKGDLEADLQTWLETNGVENAWEAAPTLAALGYAVADLETIRTIFLPPAFSVVVQWMATAGIAQTLLLELKLSADRIAQTVQAVKAYSYLDQAPVQNVDVHEGLENTLVILKHKLKAGVQVRREFAPGLPRIEAYASELNQVWTNLIDNAIDAMQGQGELKLRTAADPDHVVVEVGDTGPGISPEIQARIFDPFFTTKPPGKGTGLGLHIAQSIVARHGGIIQFDSDTSGTRFRVTLPIRLQEAHS